MPFFYFCRQMVPKINKNGNLFAHLFTRLHDYRLKLSGGTESQATYWESLTQPRISVYILLGLWVEHKLNSRLFFISCQFFAIFYDFFRYPCYTCWMLAGSNDMHNRKWILWKIWNPNVSHLDYPGAYVFSSFGK